MLHQVRLFLCALVATLGFHLVFAPAAQAQAMEERFQDMFVTAGYCTAFGAALGTAVLFLNPNTDPSTHLRYVAVGASLGFIGGSALGSYIIFAPMLADRTGGYTPGGSLATDRPLPPKGIVVRPTFDATTHALTSIESGMTLARF